MPAVGILGRFPLLENLIIGYLGGSRLRGNDKLIGVGTGDSSLRWNRNAELKVNDVDPSPLAHACRVCF